PSSRSRESCTIFSQTSRSVENERHKQNYEPLSSAFFTASSAPWNPILLWVPSQKGLLTEPPQRHRENAVLPVRSNRLPLISTSSTDPSGASTRSGPLGLTVIFTCAMNSSNLTG